MNGSKKLFLLLVCSLSTFSLIMLTSCETKPVDPISAEPGIPVQEASQVVGKITDNVTDVGISGVAVGLGGFNATTGSDGGYEFVDNIPGGNYNLTGEKAGYISISKNVTVFGEGFTTSLNYKLAETNPPVTVTPADGALIEEESNDGTITASIPPNAVDEDVEVSLTSTLGLSTPINIEETVAPNQTPVQTNTIEPRDIEFNQPVKITVPLTLPAQYMIGTIVVVRINPDTGAEEVVGTASIVGDQIDYDVTMGGDYLLRAETSLRHVVESGQVFTQIGSIGFSEHPGTSKLLDFDDISTVEVAEGFSQDLVETVFGFASSSRTLTYALSKPSGINTSLTAYVPAIQQDHTWTTETGKIIAKITANGFPVAITNGTVSNGAVGYYCVQEATHGSNISEGWYYVESDGTVGDRYTGNTQGLPTDIDCAE